MLVSQNLSILDSCASYGCQIFRYILDLTLIFFFFILQNNTDQFFPPAFLCLQFNCMTPYIAR